MNCSKSFFDLAKRGRGRRKVWTSSCSTLWLSFNSFVVKQIVSPRICLFLMARSNDSFINWSISKKSHEVYFGRVNSPNLNIISVSHKSLQWRHFFPPPISKHSMFCKGPVISRGFETSCHTSGFLKKQAHFSVNVVCRHEQLGFFLYCCWKIGI